MRKNAISADKFMEQWARLLLHCYRIRANAERRELIGRSHEKKKAHFEAYRATGSRGFRRSPIIMIGEVAPNSLI